MTNFNFNKSRFPSPATWSQLLEQDGVALAIFNANLRLTYTNRSFVHLLGHPPTADLTGFALSILPPTDQPEFQQRLHRFLEHKSEVFTYSYDHSPYGGERRYHELTISRLQSEGTRLGIIRIYDRTQQRDTVDLLQKRLSDLHEENQKLRHYIGTNLQLENFTYLASHDLKEPLRIISNFTDLLVRKHGDRLNEEMSEYVDYIQNGVRDMNSRIRDLLLFTELDRRPPELVWVDLETSLYVVQQFLEQEIQQSGTSIRFKNLPPKIFADRTKLRLIFQHLLDNAIKFARPGVSPEIEISATETPEAWTISVRDNGIGIPRSKRDKVFLLFKRLHHREHIPGSGIGLTVCRKIVEQHGGTIRIFCEEGRGTEVRFTLPKPTAVKPVYSFGK